MPFNVTIFAAPSEAGTHWYGMHKASEAMYNSNLTSKLEQNGCVVKWIDALQGEKSIWKPSPVKNGIRNEDESLRAMKMLRKTLEQNLSVDSFPLIIGGDCSLTPAIMSSLTHAFPQRRIGFLYFDNDADLCLPSETKNRGASGFLDSMTFSSLTQRPGCVESMKEFSTPAGMPTVTSDNAVLFGIECADLKPEHIEYLLDNGFRVQSNTAVRRSPVEHATRALEWLTPRVDHIHLHLDVDVIDSAEFPLGNFPSYGGIQFEDAMQALHTFVACHKVCSISIAEINPNNDHDGSMVARLVDSLTSAFGTRVQIDKT
jgi:arginase family enzyme